MSTPYPSQMTGAQIENALNKVNGLIAAANNGKILCIDNGSLAAKSAIEIQGGTVDAISITENGVYTHSGLGGYSPITVNVSGGQVQTAICVIKAIYDAGYTCTCSMGPFSYTSNTSGEWIFPLPASGTWTLSCNERSVQKAVSAYEMSVCRVRGKTYSEIKAECLLTDYVRLSNTSGDKAICRGSGQDRYFERTSNEPVLIIPYISDSTYRGYTFFSKQNTISGNASSYGDLTQAEQYTTSSGSSIYMFRHTSPWGINWNAVVKANCDSVENIFGTDTLFELGSKEFIGTNASQLEEIVDEYATAIS